MGATHIRIAHARFRTIFRTTHINTATRRLMRLLPLLLILALPATTSACSPAPANSRTQPAGTDATQDGTVAVAAAECTTLNPATPKRQFRALWIASVVNIDWPSRTGLSVAAQQAEYRGWLDLARQRRMNAVVVQIRPTADAFWPSPYEPWSHWLTGTQGTNPGYDPLAFMVAEAHARNLEFHAWFNPYRVAMHTNTSALHPSHPARQNPSWVFSYGGKLYYNPGIPTVRAFIQTAMMDAVKRYDIDGVHWDDYFYPYPVSGVAIPDQQTFNQYKGSFTNINDWRRNNINLLVKEMSAKIKQAKPYVSFGISPFGIWRNSSTDALGSRTSGLQSYDAIYADSRTWVKQQWIDYITPQIYWHIGFSAADYAVLVPWWSNVVAGTRVQLFVGQAVYKVGTSGQPAAWQTNTELSKHLTFNRSYPRVRGDVHFSAKDVRADRLGGFSRLASDHYRKPALIPVAPHLGGAAPPVPGTPAGSRVSNGVRLNWTATGSPTAYAIYRVTGGATTDPCALADARNLLVTLRSTGSSPSYTDTTASATQTYTYYVSALDRRHHESATSGPRTVAGTAFSATVDNTTAGRFTASGNWGTSSYSSQRYGANYRYARPVSASDVAWYKVNIPRTASYRVEVWYPAASGYNASTPYHVVTTTGNKVVRVDQRSNGGRWVSLGTFTLAAGDRNVVGVSRWTSGTGYVIADAIRIRS